MNESGVSMVMVGEYELREDLYYWPRGLTWAKVEPNERARIGFTDLAQKLAGKIRFIRIKPKGVTVAQGKGVATVETAKWVSSVESPVTGVVEEVNTCLIRKSSLLNESPFDDGWIVLMKMSKPGEIKKLVHREAAVDWYKKEIETRAKK